MGSYTIIRVYFDSGRRRRVIESGLTLEQVKEHCGNPETNSKTCLGSYKRAYTKKVGPWFDCWMSEG